MLRIITAWQPLGQQHGVQRSASSAATSAAWLHKTTASTGWQAHRSCAQQAALTPATVLSLQCRPRLTRQVASAAVSPLPHYAALPLDKATHLRQAPVEHCINSRARLAPVPSPQSPMSMLFLRPSGSAVLSCASACRGQPEELRRLFNQADARLVVFRGREGLVAPADQSPPAAGDAAAAQDIGTAATAAAATPDSQATWQTADLK
jgi:hypothetical protein